jgi:hypothetical protein
MVRAGFHARLFSSAAALIVLVASTARSEAADAQSYGLERHDPAPSRCAASHATDPDALPGSEDPAALMHTLRQRGLVATAASVRARASNTGSLARGVGPGSLRCDAPGPGVVLRHAPIGRVSSRD